MNSWWWAEELRETCRVSCRSKFGKLVHLARFIINKFVTMHGHMNVKKTILFLATSIYPQFVYHLSINRQTYLHIPTHPSRRPPGHISPTHSTHSSIAMAVQSKASICSHVIAGTASSNAAVNLDICLSCLLCWLCCLGGGVCEEMISLSDVCF
jgi:hypothetical protein